MNEEVLSDERNPAEGNNEIPPARKDGGNVAVSTGPATEFVSKSEERRYAAQTKTPPTPEQLVGNDLIWLIAKTCHEVNRVFSAGVLGDFTHQPWGIAPTEQRQSCYEGVMYILNNSEVSPGEIHGAWMEHKLMQGWTFGNAKSEEEKTHPNLIPFHQLHAHERAKDDIFLAICKSMLGK